MTDPLRRFVKDTPPSQNVTGQAHKCDLDDGLKDMDIRGMMDAGRYGTYTKNGLKEGPYCRVPPRRCGK